MNKSPSAPQAPGFTIDDIYYTLFRHKWVITIWSLLGIVAAALVYFLVPQPFTSETKLLIRYVQEGKGPTASTDDERMRSPDARGGEAIVGAEAEIIESLDLAQQVVDTVGADKILAKAGGGNDRQLAASLVFNGLNVIVPKKGSVLTLDFSHPDATVVQPVLSAIVDAYLKRHLEIHRPAGTFDDFLTQQTDQMRARLAQTEEELRKARAKAGIISLEDTRKAQSEQLTKLREALLHAEAELAERNATIQQMLKYVSTAQAKPTTTDDSKDPNKSMHGVPLADYQNLLKLLNALKVREQGLLLQFTPENSRVKLARSQVSDAEAAKTRMEADFPQLISMAEAAAPSEASSTTQSNFDFNTEYGRIAAMETRVKVLNSQLAQIRSEAAVLDAMESNIQELERRKLLEESNYRNFSKNLENARVDEALGVGRVTNISRIQNPTPPFRNSSKLIKIVAGIGCSGLVLGLAWSFLFEMVIDRSIRRPSQLENQLGIDLFISIPASKERETSTSVKLLANDDASKADEGGSSPAPWNPANSLHPYYAALRDRMIGFFDNRNLNHKPRLVALTGMGKDHGAAEIAAGLAGCLSETGEGNVLFVDMTTTQGAAHHFYKGETVRGLDEILEEKERPQARVADNLYVVSAGSEDERLPRILPKRFSHLIPKLRASDFDYIIFNMPPVNNTSPTPRLAGFMDVVLMVVESEKTQMESVEKAKALLSNNKSHVAAVLNKTRDYIPNRLIKDNS